MTTDLPMYGDIRDKGDWMWISKEKAKHLTYVIHFTHSYLTRAMDCVINCREGRQNECKMVVTLKELTV